MDWTTLKRIKELDPEQQYFLSKRGFIETFDQLCRATATKREAYELCEEHFERIFGRRRYSEYQNFRRIRLEFYARQKKCEKSV